MMFFYTTMSFAGVKNQSIYKQEYKRALDAATDAAAKHTTYADDINIDEFSSGFGIGLEDKNNIPMDKTESLNWFYSIFFRNLDVQDNLSIQEKLKKYIPMKAIITYHGISIADADDNWVVEKDFVIERNAREYLFTLSDQVQDISTGDWLNQSNIGLSTEERQALVVEFVVDEIEDYLNNRDNQESGYQYQIHIGLNDLDSRLKSIDGSSMIVLSEGLPLPAMNWFAPAQKYYAFSIGGSEVTRK